MKNKLIMTAILALIIAVTFFIMKKENPGLLQTTGALKGESMAFDKEKHDQYATFLINKRGFSKEDALEEALKVQIEHLALIEKAKVLGIEISDEEARNKAIETRRALVEDNNEDTLEAKRALEEAIENLGITEDEYWNEYAVNGYKEMMSIEQLKKLAADEKKHWQDFFTNIIAEFEQTYHKDIAAFKREVAK